ncbi:MAG: serine-threonine protein phosphatase, partial [Myxococcaceae bacterium]|nr:serine-threonine protein phosphatase [Myxococcaceae bacterium]
FAPGGPYAKMIAERPIVMKVGDTVFVHGGILPKHVRYGLDKMNDETRDWLLKKSPMMPPIVSGEDGPVWTRMYSTAPGREECATLDEALAAVGATRMVMGHTPQRNGISPACDNHAWRIDTGMSKFYQGKLEVLEIRGSTVTVRKLPAE